MKKSILFFTITILFFGFFGCSEKSVTHSEPKKEKSIKESLTKDLPAKFQDDLSSLNACTVVYCLQRKRIYKL